MWEGLDVTEYKKQESNDVARRAVERAQWIVCLLCENRALSRDPWSPHMH